MWWPLLPSLQGRSDPLGRAGRPPQLLLRHRRVQRDIRGVQAFPHLDSGSQSDSVDKRCGRIPVDMCLAGTV